MADLKVTRATSVKSLQQHFNKEFKCSLIIYKKNNRIADSTEKIEDLAGSNYKGGVLKLGARSRVGNVEDYFNDNFGVKVQIKNEAGTKLADNKMTLTQAGNM